MSVISQDVIEQKNVGKIASSWKLIFIPIVFVCCSLLLLFFLYVAPEGLPSLNANGTTAGELKGLRFPSTVEELKEVYDSCRTYVDVNYWYALLLFALAYLYKQTFAIPGSVLLNILAGTLYGMSVGFPLVCLLTAAGASLCYSLSLFCGGEFLSSIFPDKLQQLRAKLRQNEDGLLFFLISIRLFPLTPNWLLNIASPHVGVTLREFFIGALFGLMPYNYICVQGGSMLSEIQSVSDVLHFGSLAKLLSMACVVGAIALLKNYNRQKVD